MSQSKNPLRDELEKLLDEDLLDLLDKRDGAYRLLELLPERFSPEEVSSPTKEQRAWELTGLYIARQNRLHEALSIMAALYNQMLRHQTKTGNYTHKGMPLVWMSDFYNELGFPVHAKRYLMMTLCEDAIVSQGTISPTTSGVYFRLVWVHGLSDIELQKYAQKIYELFTKNPKEGMYPEWILQELDKGWMSELPSPAEVGIYMSNQSYINFLLLQLGDKTGKDLEQLADYLLSIMPGCRTRRRERSASTDYDIVCAMDGFDVDFRSDLGRYFVCECKDWNKPADFSTIAKFCRVLDSTKCRFGILFSKKGISGQGKTINAEREQLKVYQDRGMVIIVVDEKDIQFVAKGGNFINLLRAKYERVRLDLISSDD